MSKTITLLSNDAPAAAASLAACTAAAAFVAASAITRVVVNGSGPGV